jgi:hypothetical protein
MRIEPSNPEVQMALSRANERQLAGRIGAHRSWANTSDRTARTAKARRAFEQRFEDQVPAEITDPAERARAADHLRRAYFAELALKSAQARRRKAG